MRLFQNARYYPSLRPRIRELTRDHSTFAGKIDAFLNFREGAAHILLPVDQRAEWAFFTTRRFFATALLLAGMGRIVTILCLAGPPLARLAFHLSGKAADDVGLAFAFGAGG